MIDKRINQIPGNSMAEYPAVNGAVVGSNPTLGDL